MANEFTMQISVTLRNGNLRYQNPLTQFKANQATARGAKPGYILVPTGHVEPDFSQLVQPGITLIINIDPTYTVMVGVYLASRDEFIPLMDILPGEFYPLRQSALLGHDLLPNTGTGSAGGDKPKLSLKAVGGSANVEVLAFDT